MVKYLFSLFLALTIGPIFNAGCQTPEPEITVSDSVIKLAETFDIKYMELLEKAKKGDVNSIKEIIRFNRIADGVDGLDHAVTCLELIPFAGDAAFAQGCQSVTPNMRKYLADRLSMAQGRTKKTELQQPLKSWAPQTWAILNPAEQIPAKEGVNTGLTGDGRMKPGAAQGSDGGQPAPAAEPKKGGN